MLDRLVCLFLRQHDYVLQQSKARIFLCCRRCGVRTPGWETSSRLRVIEQQKSRSSEGPSNLPSTDSLASESPTDSAIRSGSRVASSFRILLADSDSPVVTELNAPTSSVQPQSTARAVSDSWISEPRLSLDS